METQTSASDADSTVILVDGSKSVRGTASGARGLDYGQVAGDLLDEKDEKGEVISIGTFGGPAGVVEWTVERRPADWRRSNPNADNQEQNRQDANRCLKADIAAAQQKTPADGGTDVLAALAAGTDMFEGVEGVRRLLVLSDGLATTGCADLRSARFGSAQEVESIASVCGARGKFGELPDLHGVEVTFVGLGRSAGGQPPANSAQRAWLDELWKALCERAGGSCTSSNTPVGKEKESRRAAAGSVPEDPVVPYGDGGSRSYSLSGEALFDSNSAQVRPAAVPLLTTLAATARTTPSLDRVLVDGYVDPRGGSGNNQSLSQARADAVAKVLVDQGVPASQVEAHGRGLSPGCPADTAAEAGSREQRLQCDRRVNVKIIGK